MKDGAIVEKIKKTSVFYSTSLLIQMRGLIWPLVRYRFEKPVFIIGCSRSGTTLVYKVLSMAKGLASLQKESHDFWNYLHPPEEKNWDSHWLNAEDVSETDRIEVARFFFKHLGMRRFVDKANQNCFRIPYLLELFPDAIFVYIKRDGRDNVNSLIHGWGRPEEFGGWSHNIPARVQVENVTYTRWCFFLFPGWRKYLHSPVEEVCAQQWISANQAVLSSRAIVPRRQWVEIFYEDILGSPVDTFRKVYKELSLSFDKKIEKHCEDLASNLYNAFSAPRLEKWKQENPERIMNILPIISKTMLDMGYKV